VILEIETDKATMDVEAQDDGILAKIIVRIGPVQAHKKTKLRHDHSNKMAQKAFKSVQE